MYATEHWNTAAARNVKKNQSKVTREETSIVYHFHHFERLETPSQEHIKIKMIKKKELASLPGGGNFSVCKQSCERLEITIQEIGKVSIRVMRMQEL